MNTVHIVYESSPKDPRPDCDNFGTMHCAHGRYNLGDKSAKEELIKAIRGSNKYRESWENRNSDNYRNFNSPAELFQTALDADVIGAYLPLYLYDHSGITMATTPFNCPWDSGQVGHIFITKEKLRNEYGISRITRKAIKKAEDLLQSEIKVYDFYLTGQVFGFEIRDEDGDVTDSCYGFYGDNRKENGILDYIPEEYHKEALEAEAEF